MPDIDLRGQSGDVVYRCPECGWSVTLTPEAETVWLGPKDHRITPRCTKDECDLIRKVIP